MDEGGRATQEAKAEGWGEGEKNSTGRLGKAQRAQQNTDSLHKWLFLRHPSRKGKDKSLPW